MLYYYVIPSCKQGETFINNYITIIIIIIIIIIITFIWNHAVNQIQRTVQETAKDLNCSRIEVSERRTA